MSSYLVRPITMDNKTIEVLIELPKNLGTVTLKHVATPGLSANNASPYIDEMLKACAALAAKEDVSQTLNAFVNRPKLLGIPMHG